MKKSLPKEWKADLPETQENDLVQKAFRQKFDAELRQKWAGQLAAAGVERRGHASIVPLKQRRMNWWAVAASLLVLLGAAWWLTMKPALPNSEALADRYFLETADQVAQNLKGENNVDAVWQTAQDQYAAQKFADAIRTVESMAPLKPLDAKQLYFLAFCQLQIEPPAFDQALASLEAARQSNIANKTTDFQAEIEWAAALTLLRKKDLPAATEQLRKIEQANGWYAGKARQLLDAMK